MNNPEEYSKHGSTFQKRDAKLCLEKYKVKLNLKNKASVVDLGTGDGSALNNILKSYLPEDFIEVIGLDVSEKMISFAVKKYGDERTAFKVMDIAGKINQEFKERFDHAFSFSALHFVHNQEQAFKNIYDLLAPNGNCLLVFCGRHDLYKPYIALSKTKKWKQFMENIDTFIPRYHHMSCKETEQEIERIAKDAGFRIVHVECNEVKYVYDSIERLAKMVEACNLFNIPKKLNIEYTNEYMELAAECTHLNNATGAVTITYRRIEFFGVK